MNVLRSWLKRHNTFILSIGFLVVFSVSVSYAVPPTSPYTAGETLDPSCAPGDANCTVKVSPWTVTGNDVSYTAGNVGIGTTTPGAALTIQRAVGNTPLILLKDANGVELARIASDNSNNLFMGFEAGKANVATSVNSGERNTFIGSYAGWVNSTGAGNTGIGYASLFSTTTATYNTALGGYALGLNTIGGQNNAQGYSALYKNISGNNNGALGYYALYSNTTGSANNGMGHFALYSNTTGDYNIAVGTNTLWHSVTTGSYNIALGSYVEVPDGTLNGQLNIGNVLYGTGLYQDNTASSSTPTTDGRIGIGTSAPQNTLDVNGGISAASLSLSGPAAGQPLDAPTAIDATVGQGGGVLFGDEATQNFRVYSYKIVNGGKVFSPTYATLDPDLVEPNITNQYHVDLTWDAVDGADGYRILHYLAIGNNVAFNYNYYADTTVPSYTYDVNVLPTSGSTVTPTTPSSVVVQGESYLNGDLDIIGTTNAMGNFIVGGTFADASSTVTGTKAIAYGDRNIASGNFSVAFGSGLGETINGSLVYTRNTASGTSSTVFGSGNVASGLYSLATGTLTRATGTSSASFGDHTIAASPLSAAFGRFNVGVSSGVALEVGNGTDADNRANALTLLANGSLGLNTSSPRAALDIAKDGSILATGTLNAGMTVPDLGAGTRLMWIPRKGAFRVGTAGTTEWDNANVGMNSFASGVAVKASGGGSAVFGESSNVTGNNAFGAGFAVNASGDNAASFNYITHASGSSSAAFGAYSTASGEASVVFGSNTLASGNFSAAFGLNTAANGINSVAYGQNTTASGVGSLAGGIYTIASGDNAVAFGDRSYAAAYDSVAIGRYNVSGGNATTWVDTDPLFEIGNGADSLNHANALTVLKNGNIGIGTATPLFLLDVNGNTNINGTETVGNLIASTTHNGVNVVESSVTIIPTVTQTGSSAYAGVTVFPYITSGGSGGTYIISGGTSASPGGTRTTNFYVSTSGTMYLSNSIFASGQVQGNSITTNSAATNTSGGVETLGQGFSLTAKQYGVNFYPSGATVPKASVAYIGKGTMVSSIGSPITYTDANTLYIDGAPIAGSAVTITNPYALYVNSGTSYFGGTVQAATLLNVGSAAVTTGTTVARFQNAGGTCDVIPSASGGITCSSDMNLKKNISLLSDNSTWSYNTNIAAQNQSVLNKVLALVPVQYNWKNVEQDTDAKHAGFIAQEVQQVFADLVTKDPDTQQLSLNYTGLIPYTIQAIQDMNFNIIKLDDLDRPNNWRTSLIAWLGSTTNGIQNIFSKKVTTDQLCVHDADGETCLNRSQINQILNTHPATTPIVTTPSEPVDEEPIMIKDDEPVVTTEEPTVVDEEPVAPPADTTPVETPAE